MKSRFEDNTLSARLRGCLLSLAWGAVGSAGSAFILWIVWKSALTGTDDDTGPMAAIFPGFLSALITATGGILGLILGYVFGRPLPGRKRGSIFRSILVGVGVSSCGIVISILFWWIDMTWFYDVKADGLMAPILGWVVNAIGVMVIGVVATIRHDSKSRSKTLSQESGAEPA